MKQIQLKKCPFCGGTADYKAYMETAVYIQCRKCYTTSDVFNSTDFYDLNCIAASEAWNRRANNAG